MRAYLTLDGGLACRVHGIVREVVGPRLAGVLRRVPLAEQLLAARRRAVQAGAVRVACGDMKSLLPDCVVRGQAAGCSVGVGFLSKCQ